MTGHSPNRPAAAGLACAALLLALAADAQAQQQVYRYQDQDGRVVYTDKPPPASAKNPQTKRIGANYIDTSEVPIAAQQAAERFPVTLYTFQCGEVCQSAEALLNRRGVPFSTVDVQDAQNAARLQQLTGDLTAPVLQVGDKLVIKGYNEARWQATLDEAGYPKTPAPRRVQPGRQVEAPVARTDTQSATVPAGATTYPK